MSAPNPTGFIQVVHRLDWRPLPRSGRKVRFTIRLGRIYVDFAIDKRTTRAVIAQKIAAKINAYQKLDVRAEIDANDRNRVNLELRSKSIG